MRLFEVYLSSSSGRYVEGKVLARDKEAALNKAKKLLAKEKDHKYCRINNALIKEIEVSLELK